MQLGPARGSQSGGKLAAGDPRRPAQVHSFDKSTVNTDDRSPDALLLVAVILALAALMMKVKLAAWASLITVLSAVANTPFGTADSFKHTVSAVTFSVVSVAACYIVPVRASP